MPNSNTSQQSITDHRAIGRDIFSATVGSICCCYVGQPFDTVKVRMQTNPTVFPSIHGTVASISTHEGVAAFWKGSVPTAMGMVAENAVAFGVHEALKRAFPVSNIEPKMSSGAGAGAGGGPPGLVQPFAIGALTGCCAAIVLLPSEVIKAKLQVEVGQSVPSTFIWKRMLAKQGFHSVAVGLDAQLARDAAFYAVFFGGYEMSCYLFRTYIPSMPDELNYFISGGLAGMLGWAVAMPLDVPKTNVQSRYDTKIIGSFVPEFLRITRERGIAGLYNGLVPTLIRAFPANAALFLGVELGKEFFDKMI